MTMFPKVMSMRLTENDKSILDDMMLLVISEPYVDPRSVTASGILRGLIALGYILFKCIPRNSPLYKRIIIDMTSVKDIYGFLETYRDEITELIGVCRNEMHTEEQDKARI